MYIGGEKKPGTVWISQRTDYSDFELDELYSFLGRKSRTEDGENTYICTMISRLPRQIVAFDIANRRTEYLFLRNGRQCKSCGKISHGRAWYIR